ncbi:MAG: hypothetical protein ABUL66_01100, partial [Verrucomicrobiota bacterium]
MKYQFQFAGANVARPKPSPRRRLSMGLMLAALALAALAYGYYLYHASHIRAAAVKPAAALAATASAKTTAAAASEKVAEATAVPVAAAASESQVPSAAKSTAETGIAGAWNHALETLKTATAAPAPAPHLQSVEVTGPATQPKTVAVSSTATPVAVKPVAPRWRPLTDEQRLARAGEVAMENMLVQATKYPGAYGFRVEDAFEKATLGKAIPIYT